MASNEPPVIPTRAPKTRIPPPESFSNESAKRRMIDQADAREVRRLRFDEHLDVKMIRLRLASQNRRWPSERTEKWIQDVIMNRLHADVQ